MTTVAVPGVAYARANWGRWVADCPSPHCRSALQIPLFEQHFQCWDCGATAPVEWPPYAEDVERLLMLRPNPFTRNWEPGEDLVDLLHQNLEHGITGPVADKLDTGRLLQVHGDRIVYDELTTHRPRLTLGG